MTGLLFHDQIREGLPTILELTGPANTNAFTAAIIMDKNSQCDDKGCGVVYRGRANVGEPSKDQRPHFKLTRYFLNRIIGMWGFNALAANAQSIDSLRQEFANPPKTMRPMVQWW
jgi:hypothetical protein